MSNTNATNATDTDVIVVGCGIGGLSAALRLAASGLRVRVVEASNTPGGKIGERVHDGAEFDTGPSLLTMRDHLDELFTACGARLEDELELITHDTGFRYLWEDGARFDVHFALEDTRQSVQRSFGSTALREFDSFMAYSRAIWEAALPNFVDGQAPSVGAIMRLGMTRLREVSRIDPFRTMRQGIARHISEPHLRDVMWRYATYNGSNALTAPATLNCIAWVELGLGGYGVRGGMKAIPRALERVGQRLGVQFEYGARVAQVCVERGRTTGVMLESGARYSAPVVVVNADVAHLKTQLFGPHVAHGLGDDPPASMSGWTAVVRARRDPARAPHTVLFPAHYEDEFTDIFDHDRAPHNPTVYLCDQAQSHGRPGWSEQEGAVFIMANAPCEPLRGARPEVAWTELRARVFERLHHAGLMPGDEQVVWERTPTQLAAEFVGSRGAIYGAASNTQLAAFKRPSNRLKDVPGVYLASGSAHPGGGVPLCMLSGKWAARHVIEDGLVRVPQGSGARLRAHTM